MSFSTITPSKFELSPMRITYKGVDLGGSLGNVAINIETMLADLRADQFGEGIIDQKVSGLKMTISTELTQIKDPAIWKVVFPFYKQVGTDPYSFYFDNEIGAAASDYAGALILHPLSMQDSDKSQDYKFYKAFAVAKSEPSYGPKEQVKLKVEFMILPDFTTQPARYMLFGDPAIGLVAGSAVQASYTGTGNGTMGSISVGTSPTTQTVTVQCIAAQTNAGLFKVTGALTGIIGVATVGVAFSSSQVNFTISDGSTDFIVGDVFTITLTAPNYV